MMIISISKMSSCEDTMLNNMVDDNLYLLKTGINETQVFNFEKAVAELVVVKSGVGQRSAKLNIDVVPELLTKYFQEEEATYSLLSESVYTISNTSLVLPKDAYLASFEFIIDVQKFKDEQAKHPDVTFVIPCEITNLEPGSGDQVKMESLMIPKIIEPYIAFSNHGFLTEIKNITSSSQDSVYFNNKIEINFPSENNIKYTIGFPQNSMELIHKYNDENNTSYVQLPSEALDLQSNGVIMKGANYSEYTFQVLKNKLVDMDSKPKYGNYILPLIIKEVSLGKIHPNNSIVLIPFHYYE